MGATVLPLSCDIPYHLLSQGYSFQVEKNERGRFVFREMRSAGLTLRYLKGMERYGRVWLPIWGQLCDARQIMEESMRESVLDGIVDSLMRDEAARTFVYEGNHAGWLALTKG